MGYGVPAALAAKAVDPARQVVCFAGDGDFLMSGQELATAMQYDLPVLVVVVDNGMLGTIRMHQERRFPGRTVGTDLRNPDFAAFARSFGAFGENVERTEDFPAALERALASGTAAVVALQLDPEAITPRTTLTALRRAARERSVQRPDHDGRAGAAAEGPLAGLRLAVKDLIDTAGIRTTYGSSIYADHVPERTATGGRAPARRRRAARRQGEPARVRLGRHEPEPVVRHGAEPGRARGDGGRLVRAATRPRSPPGSATSASGPTRAARSGCRRPAAASSA